MGSNPNIKLLIMQAILIIILIFVVVKILKAINSYKLEKRISKYGIDSLNNNTSSISDVIIKNYKQLIKSLSSILNKSFILKKRSKKYNEYSKEYNLKPMDFISIKITLIMISLLIVVIYNILKLNNLTIIQVLISILLGIFIPNIYLYIRELFRKRRIDEDMLKAIIIMNNAFKSGRTTMQAIEIVKNEVDGPIGEEFNKMYADICFGLSLDVAFERFAKRIDNDDARYISASLTILNKTGGDIVKVFSSIEKSFFNRRKLKNELKTLTASSNVMFKFLLIAPFVIFFIIFFLNPEYFKPLISSVPGLILSGLIILIFGLYIFIIKKVMKIKV